MNTVSSALTIFIPVMWWPLMMVQPFANDVCENNYIFEMNDLRSGDIEMPVLANGHIAFMPNGDSIYMNGVYNGFMDKTHRARIPNLAQIQFEPCGWDQTNLTQGCLHALDMKRAVFTSHMEFIDGPSHYSVEQVQFAHRHFDRTIVNQITINQNAVDTNGIHKIRINLIQTVNSSSVDLSTPLIDHINIQGHGFELFYWHTLQLEDSWYQNRLQDIYVLREIVPSMITLSDTELNATFSWITIVGRNQTEVITEAQRVLQSSDSLLKSHTYEWMKFWDNSSICVEGNEELDRVIHASIFALISSLPSLNTSQARHTYYGLSPQGLGVGGPNIQEGYRGHGFWDTEIWMQPSVLLFEPQWSKELLQYRHLLRKAANDNAHNTGYKGLRYPWESAFTGRDVTWAEYPEIVKYQQHVTADIAFALRKHIFATHDTDLLQQFGCDLAVGTATFWASRVSHNISTNRFDINDIMGPDEDHFNINNNAYTNVAASMNLHFGSFANCLCNQMCPSIYPASTNWSAIASSIQLLYDAEKDYNPQYDGYILGTQIKQADVVLLAYPLQYSMAITTKRNNLNIYANVTRDSGPAMTWSIHALGHLDIGDVPSEAQFNRAFLPYIRKPFYTWNEYVHGVKDGAENFITGAGGFLQLIIYGYAGIQINADAMVINGPQLPPNTNKVTLNGINYLGMRFRLEIWQINYRLTFQQTPVNLRIIVNDIEIDSTQMIYEFMRSQLVQLKSNVPWNGNCPLPKDDLNQPFITPDVEPAITLIE